MTISYHSLGGNKRMCDVVFAGSHDAGINEGGAPTKAQSDTIAVQTGHGARFFDVRVGAFLSDNILTGQTKIKLKTFHAAESLQFNKTSDYKLKSQTGKTTIETMSLPLGGHTGELLNDILIGAKNFVENVNTEEFLVLIFSKSTNMSLVVKKVDAVLGRCQFATHGNLNTKTLDQLGGHVVCVYTEESALGLELDSYRHHADGATGPRFGMKNLSKGGTYEARYNGIQYYGKGGLTAKLSDKEKVDENAGLQLEKMKEGARVAGHQTMLGMVYVTATGGIGSLKDRDKKLWKDKRINPLLNIWENDEVATNIRNRLPRNIDPTAQHSVAVIKNFFPNIVMMDFTSTQRCQTIFDLNLQSPGPMGAKRTLSRPQFVMGSQRQ